MLLYLAALPVLPGSTAAVDAAAGQPYLGRCPVLAALLESPVLSPLWRQLLDSGAGSSGSSDAVMSLACCSIQWPIHSRCEGSG